MPPNRKQLKPDENQRKLMSGGWRWWKKWASSKNRIIFSKSKMTKLKTVK
jgi:hypothetical protein